MNALVVFGRDVERLSSFYAAILGGERRADEFGNVRVRSASSEVLVHSLPKVAAHETVATRPPAARADVAMKPVFDVPHLDNALTLVATCGGVVLDQSFVYEGLERHDVLDPEGNVVQLRSAV
jgi:predicted enzyme related to lactoylglutathione lyase